MVLFTLLWHAWLNGTLYHDLHGSDDGRSRIYLFVQMLLVALMAVHADEATRNSEDGRRFAVLLSALLVWLMYQWWVERRQDAAQMARLSTPYLIGLAVILALVVVNIAVEDPSTRLTLWAVGAAGAIVVPLAGSARRHEGLVEGFRISESTAVQFALFTIIVLGEVVVGVVQELTEADGGWATEAVGGSASASGSGSGGTTSTSSGVTKETVPVERVELTKGVEASEETSRSPFARSSSTPEGVEPESKR